MTSEEPSSAPWLAAAAVLERLPNSVDTPQTDGGSPTDNEISAMRTLSTRGGRVVSNPTTTDVEVSIILYGDAIGLQLTTASGHVTALLSTTDAEALAERLQTAAAEHSTDDISGESWP
jgi:3-deoxy-D-manno-octulosonate 8-phosphate phosphatase KdsC-like HAD superfamily phosphatase